MQIYFNQIKEIMFRYSGITVFRYPEKEQISRKISSWPSCGARKALKSADSEALRRGFCLKNRTKPLATSRKRIKLQKYRTFCAKYLHVSEKCSNFVRFLNFINHEILGIPVSRKNENN